MHELSPVCRNVSAALTISRSNHVVRCRCANTRRCQASHAFVPSPRQKSNLHHRKSHCGYDGACDVRCGEGWGPGVCVAELLESCFPTCGCLVRGVGVWRWGAGDDRGIWGGVVGAMCAASCYLVGHCRLVSRMACSVPAAVLKRGPFQPS